MSGSEWMGVWVNEGNMSIRHIAFILSPLLDSERKRETDRDNGKDDGKILKILVWQNQICFPQANHYSAGRWWWHRHSHIHSCGTRRKGNHARDGDISALRVPVLVWEERRTTRTNGSAEKFMSCEIDKSIHHPDNYGYWFSFPNFPEHVHIVTANKFSGNGASKLSGKPETHSFAMWGDRLGERVLGFLLWTWGLQVEDILGQRLVGNTRSCLVTE